MSEAQIAASADRPSLKNQLKADLTVSMKARDTVRTATIRMAMTAVHAEEVAGTSARELSNDEVVSVLGREAKKRRESAAVYDDAGRGELADRERAELAVLETYLPQQLSDEELTAIVTAAVEAAAASGANGKSAMGAVMGKVRALVGNRADGSKVAAEVRRQLGM